MSVVMELFYDSLYTGCVCSWFVLAHSLYGSFRHGVNRSGRELPLAA